MAGIFIPLTIAYPREHPPPVCLRRLDLVDYLDFLFFLYERVFDLERHLGLSLRLEDLVHLCLIDFLMCLINILLC